MTIYRLSDIISLASFDDYKGKGVFVMKMSSFNAWASQPKSRKSIHSMQDVMRGKRMAIEHAAAICNGGCASCGAAGCDGGGGGSCSGCGV